MAHQISYFSCAQTFQTYSEKLWTHTVQVSIVQRDCLLYTIFSIVHSDHEFYYYYFLGTAGSSGAHCSSASTHTHTQHNVSPDNRAQLARSEWNEHQKHPANCYISPFWQNPPSTSAFVIASYEKPSVGFELGWNLSLAVLFPFLILREKNETYRNYMNPISIVYNMYA